jgi:hypothetical protein
MMNQTQNHIHKKTFLAGAGILLFLSMCAVWLNKDAGQLTTVQAQQPPESTSTPQVLGLQRIFKVNVPSTFRELVTMLALEVEGESIFGGEVSFENDVVFDGQITLSSDVFADGVNLDLGSGELTASNVLYSLEAGSGISISDGQNPTISATDVGSAQSIFKKVKVGSDTAEADDNSDTLEIEAGSGISLSLSTGSDKLTISNSTLPGFIKSGTYAVLTDGVTRVGIGTSTPTNTVEINSGTTNTAGLTFTNLTSASPVGIGGGKVLSVDSGGNIILVTDESGGVTEGDLDSALPGGSLGSTVYHDGTTWAHTTNLYHNGGQVGISTIPGTNIRFDVNTNSASAVGMVVRRVSGQTANLLQFRNESDSILSYFDADGVFHGQTAGGLNPGLSTGSVLFQGSSGITQDNGNFFWDDTNNRLGIGSTAPADRVSIYNSNQLLANGRGQLGLYSTDSQDVDLGATLVLGGQDGNAISRSFAAIAGRKANNTSGDRGGYLQLSVRRTGITSELTERMRITGDGLVGIGTTTPQNRLDIEGAVAIGANYSGSNTAPSNGLIVQGNTGIGTSGPLAKLHIAGTADDQQLIVQANSTQTLNLQEWQNSSGGTLASVDPLGNLTVPRLYTSIIRESVDNNTWISLTRLNATNNDITLGNVSTVNTITAALKDNGRFGIGGSSLTPIHKLHVSGNYAGNALVAFNETGGQDILTASASGTTRMLVSNTGQLGINSSTFVNANNVLRINGNAAVTNPTVYFDADLSANDSSPVLYLRGRYVGVSTQLLINAGGSNPFISASGGSNDLILQHTGNNGKGILIYDEASNPIAHFWNNGTGRVGIGPIQSVHKLHVQDAVPGKALVALNETGDQNILVASASGTTRMVLTNGGDLGLGTTTPSSKLDVNGQIRALYTSGYGFYNTANLTANIVSNGNAELIFQLGASSLERMRILYNGKVGIGATAPGSTVPDLWNNVDGSKLLQISSADTNTDSGLLLRRSDDATGLDVWTDNGSGLSYIDSRYNNDAGNIYFRTKTAGTPVNAMTILGSGNVGIGTTNPASKLTVHNGEVRIQRDDTSAGSFGFYSGSSTSYGGWIQSSLSSVTSYANSYGLILGNIFSSSPTSGSYNQVEVRDTFNPTSGNANQSGLAVATTINQTGGASGITRGLYINPTLTAAANWRGIDIANNSGYGIYQSGASALNYFNGNVGIGIAPSLGKLHTRGTLGDTYISAAGTQLYVARDTFATVEIEAATTGLFGTSSNHGMSLQTNSVERVRIDTFGNVSIGGTTFGASAAKVLAIAGSTAPTTAITDGIQLFAVDQAGSHELRVMDEAGNTTTLSPHNFSLTGGRSEDLAWSFYSERNSLAINADMTKALRVVEKLSGEKLIYLKDLATGEMLENELDATQLTELAESGSIGTLAKWNYQLWTFLGEVIFEKPVTFLADITLQGRIFFSPDQVGTVTIPAGETMVKVTFTQALPVVPVMQLTPQQPLAAGVALQEVTTTHFVIALPEALAEDTQINWFAALKNTANAQEPKVEVVSPAENSAAAVVASPTPTTSPTPVVSPVPTSSPAPTATPEATTLPTPESSPSTEPSPSPTATLGDGETTATSSAVTP